MSGTGVVYIIRHKDTGRVYVGQTVRLEKRMREHMRADTYFGNALRKHGREAFSVMTISYPRDWLDFWESYWIANLGSLCPRGFNMTEGGNNAPKSEESRRRMSSAKLGKPQSEEHRRHRAEAQTGKKLSADRCARRSAAMTGRCLSEETKRKLSAINIGKVASPETRAKMSASNIGKHSVSIEQRRKMLEGYRRFRASRAVGVIGK